MLATRHSAFLFSVSTIVIFYGYIYLFFENEKLRALGAAIIPLVGGTVCCVWLLKAYRVISSKERNFWLLISIGVMFYVLAYVTWLLSQIIYRNIEYPTVASLLWILAYIMFLIALGYKIKIAINTYTVNSRYLFNIIIFMIIAITISFHYLIIPILVESDTLLSINFGTLAYPVTNLGILFTTIFLYYLTQNKREKNFISIIILAFLIQIFADSIYVYLMLTNSYILGAWLDPIWLVSILTIGVTSFYARAYARNSNTEKQNKQQDNNVGVIFPYMCVVLLLVLVLQSYDWDLNLLSIGLIVTFFMIIGRQLYVLKRNQNLVKQYRYLAYHDPLTGLKNRTKFREDLKQIMDIAKQTENAVAIILLDLDRFKTINDTLGHYVGDTILQVASIRLRDSAGENNSIYRLGGDEFVLLLSNSTESSCVLTANKILKAFEEPFQVANRDITVSPSIGISMYPENGEDSITLLKNADAAMYLAKENGKNNYKFFNKKLNEDINRKMLIENELRKAIPQNQLRLVYQPKVELKSRKTYGMEALLRWDHPSLGTISPTEFIPLAEETGQIVKIGEWVLKNACNQMKIWHEKGYDSLCVSVNVSAVQMQHSDFIQMVKEIVNEINIDPKYVELEITESIMQNTKETVEILHEIKAIGIKTSIDDFGTGYSSLHLLKVLPIDTLKIDKSFIEDTSDVRNLSMVKTIIDIGKNLDMRVVAEGIEHEKQIQSLLKHHCDYGQGYYYAQPLPAQDIEKLLISGELMMKA
ncbi:diguanylate cyclase (GGDEF)-like protein [Salirhabdus euzebyi]|uniref:Diguanylate cyclase (GGDEF)-like protein n=1 Tax=Salirhabdus euzebyi TaxID=394506 RepID=A0A841Q472_9BACI|nr:EAL domain-containing protein [Salirhabdus euzebyi]MBB6453163.1 diguanylate cyclase (GGDEF)-like protein [Salirhabdus euzebyi]